MNAYVRDNPSLQGANEWDLLGSSLQSLAAAYGTAFPLPEDAVVRRIGDGELVEAATATSGFARDFGKVLGKSTRGMDELAETVATARKDLKTLSELGKELASRIRSKKPASAQARELLATFDRLNEQMTRPELPETVAANWQQGLPALAKIAQAFDLETPILGEAGPLEND